MSKKKVNFQSDVLKQEFALSKHTETKKYYYFLYAAVILIVCAVVGYFIYLRSNDLSVDWYAYGKAVSSITTDYNDYDRVIISINDDVKVTKTEYYKMKILNDYTFNALMETYERYIKSVVLTEEEKLALKPVRMSDDEIIKSITDLEVGYLIAMAEGIHMDYATSYSQVNATYLSYQKIMEAYTPEYELYQDAEESLRQMELVASGMGFTMDEYLEYLAEDSIKAFAVTALEEQWQTEFKEVDFDGTVDDYIAYKYEKAYENYNIVYNGLR